MAVSVKRFLNQTNLPEDLKNEAVPFLSTVGASLGYTYDPMLESIYNQIQFPNIDLQYSPEDDLEGYEEYQDHLLYARNKNHMTSMKRGIKENEARREVLANSSFWAQLGAGVFDPVNLIALPLGGPALTVGKAALRGAVGVGALQTGLEAIRYPVDPLATVSESALNIGFAAVTGGLITGAVSIPMVRRNNAINKTIQQHEENYNVGYEFSTLGQMTDKDIKISQKLSSRKQYKNKTNVDLRNETNLNFKTIFGYDKILETGFLPDGNVGEENVLKNISVKKNKLEESTLRIDRELAIRRLEAEDIKIKDPYNLAAGAWVANLISTPAKRILKSAIPDSVKRTSVELFADGGMLMNLHKLGFSHGPSIHQLSKIMDGEWVGAHSELMKTYGNSIKTKIKSAEGMQVKDAATRIGNKFNKQKSQTSDEWFRNVNRKRTLGEKVDGPEAEAIEIINKFFKKWEERLEDVGLIGSKRRIESLIGEGKIKRKRIVDQFNTYKNPRARWVEDFNLRLDRLDVQLEEWEFSLATMADENFTLVKGEEFLPRYWNKDYITTNRESFAKILHNWYSKNPYTYEIDGNLKWKRIDLKTSKQAIADRVEKTIDNILGLSDAEDVPNVGAGKSKHLKHRTLDIPNSLVWDYMQQDPLAIMKGYTHKTAGKYQFAKKNNGKNLLEVLDEKIDEMHIEGTPIEEIDKWRMNYKHMYDRIVSSPMKTSPDRWDNQTAYWLKEAAQLNYLGSAGLSAIPDFAKIIMEHELGDVIKGLQGLLTDTRVTLKGEEAKLVGEAIELIQGNSQFRLMESITNDVTATNTYDRVKNTFYLANGLAPITQLAKTLDSIIRGHSLIDMSIKLTNNEASKLQISYLAKYNIDKNIAAEIAAAPWEQTGDGLYLPNTKSWGKLDIKEVINDLNKTYKISDKPTFEMNEKELLARFKNEFKINKIVTNQKEVNDFFNAQEKNTILGQVIYGEDDNNIIYLNFDNIKNSYKKWQTRENLDEFKNKLDETFRNGVITETQYYHQMSYIKNVDLIKDVDDFYRFVLLHELQHTINPQGAAEPLPVYEKRIDKEAFAYLRNEKNEGIKLAAEKIVKNAEQDSENVLTTFRTALQSGILNTVIMGTPADKPIIVDGVAYIPMRVAKTFNMPEDKIVKGFARIESGLLGLPFQFYSYSLGALNKISMSAAQGQMKNRALGLSMSLGLGMLAVQVKTPDWAFENMDWDDWFIRGFDQSGIAAIYSDLFYTSMQTALAMGAPNITGGIVEPKFPSDDAYGAAIGIGGAGPSIGYDYASAMKEFFIDGDYSEGAKNFTRSLPFARLWFWKGLVNDWTNSFKNWF